MEKEICTRNMFYSKEDSLTLGSPQRFELVSVEVDHAEARNGGRSPAVHGRLHKDNSCRGSEGNLFFLESEELVVVEKSVECIQIG